MTRIALIVGWLKFIVCEDASSIWWAIRTNHHKCYIVVFAWFVVLWFACTLLAQSGPMPPPVVKHYTSAKTVKGAQLLVAPNLVIQPNYNHTISWEWAGISAVHYFSNAVFTVRHNINMAPSFTFLGTTQTNRWPLLATNKVELFNVGVQLKTMPTL